MKHVLTVGIGILVFIFLGCPARSIHPLFTENDVKLNSALFGTWRSNDDTYTFTPASDRTMKAVIRSLTSEDSAVYTTLAGTIGNQWYLDSYPYVNADEHHYLSVHVFTKMTLSGDTLTLASFENDWLEKQITDKIISIPHIRRGSEIILTASTKELQSLFRAVGENNDAFPNTTNYVRIR
jgi:hypothetical protein